MAGNKVLLAGASGFLGQAVLARLQRAGHETVGLDIKPPAEAMGATHITDDLSDPARLAAIVVKHRPSHIVHAGGVSGPMVLGDQPMATLRINVGGTLNLLEAALAGGVSTFIHCSSLSAIGNYYEAGPIGAQQPMRPASPYGASKAACEMLLQGLHGRVPLELCALRFTSIYGAGRQTSLITDVIADAAIAGRTAEVEAVSDWPYVYVDDAADAVLQAAFSQRRRQLSYYIAYPEQVTAGQLAAAAAEALGRPAVAVAMSGLAVSRGPVDISPAGRDFGYAPKIDHREGMRRLVEARRHRA